MITLTHQHQVLRVQTIGQYGRRLPLELCAEVMAAVSPLLTYSLRMAVEGASALRGARPRWLEHASDVRFVDYTSRNGDTLLHLDAPVLGDAAPELFEQVRLWPEGPSPESTAVDLLGTAVRDVRDANSDSARYDRQLLSRLARFRDLVHRQVSSIWLPAQPGRNGEPVAVDEQVAATARELSNSTPPAQEVRVVGKLDMIRHSTRSFGLKMQDDSEVRGVLEDASLVETIGSFFGRKVLVLGRAVYRPSGSVLRIEARAVAEGEGQPRLFEKVPAPRRSRPPVVRFKPGEARSWLDSFFGKWPGDETAEELEVMLRRIRG